MSGSGPVTVEVLAGDNAVQLGEEITFFGDVRTSFQLRFPLAL